jgi:hypothetical protein
MGSTMVSKHSTLLAFCISIGCSAAFVACGSDPNTGPPSFEQDADADIGTGTGGSATGGTGTGGTGTGGTTPTGGTAGSTTGGTAGSTTGGTAGSTTGGTGGATGGDGGGGTGGALDDAGPDVITNGDAATDAMLDSMTN